MRVGLLGPFEVRNPDGAVVEVPGVRLRALLAALALEPGRIVPPYETGRLDLGAATARGRGERPAGAGVPAAQGVTRRGDRGGFRRLPAGRRPPDAVDACRFERLTGQARAAEPAARAELLRTALALWRGTAMADLALRDSELFDAAVRRLDELHVAALGDRVDADIRLGRGSELVSELTDLVAAYPLREGFVAALMRALAEAGRTPEALTVYQRTRERLAEELGADPSAELSALHVALLRGEVGERAEQRRTNLRAELTSFVGKDEDVSAVAALAVRHRLVTLTGPGGSGKTRLAAETARTMLAELPDGAWLVELAPVRAGGELAQAALTALGLREQALLGGVRGGDRTDRLIAAVRERAILLILDNCEHVIEEAAAFADRLLGSAGACGSWPPAGSRSGSPGRCCGRSSRSRCPPSGRTRPRSGPRPRCGCCATARAWCARTSAPTRPPCRPWRGSAGRSTGCRWRSSSPRHGCARCPSISWHAGWTIGSGC
ncbi:BTAD domain-containing putative transcriptional regulator [Nonomuraea ferruginea]